MKKAITIFVTLLVCVVLLCSCSSATTSTPASTAPTSSAPATSAAAVARSVLGCPQGGPDLKLTPQYGGTLKIIYNNNPTNLGAPWKLSQAWDKTMGRFAIENLIGLDSLGNPIPQLASDWTADPVAMTIVFTLRQGVTFQDGTPFNATAAKWCLDKYRTGGVYKDLAAVTAINVIDDYHLQLTFSSWDPLFIQQLSSTAAGRMVSPTAAQKLIDAGKESDILLNPVGTGPFKFVSFQPNVALKFAKYDGYWQKGLPYLDAVEVDFVADSVVALASFTKGEAQILYGVTTNDAAKLKAAGNSIATSTLTIMGICGDSKNLTSYFSNISFRQAIAYAINVKKDVDAIYSGLMASTTQLALPGCQGYDSSIVGYPYNPDKARDLLSNLGISTVKPLTIDFVYGADPQRNDLFALVQGDLAKVGINITLKPVDRAQLAKLTNAGWTNQLLQLSFSYNGIEMQYSTSFQNNLSADKTSQVSVDTPAALQALFLQAKNETNQGKREALYEQINKMAIDTYCMVIPIFALQNLSAYAPKAHDCGVFDRTSGEFLPEAMWLSK